MAGSRLPLSPAHCWCAHAADSLASAGLADRFSVPHCASRQFCAPEILRPNYRRTTVLARPPGRVDQIMRRTRDSARCARSPLALRQWTIALRLLAGRLRLRARPAFRSLRLSSSSSRRSLAACTRCRSKRASESDCDGTAEGLCLCGASEVAASGFIVISRHPEIDDGPRAATQTPISNIVAARQATRALAFANLKHAVSGCAARESIDDRRARTSS